MRRVETEAVADPRQIERLRSYERGYESSLVAGNRCFELDQDCWSTTLYTSPSLSGCKKLQVPFAASVSMHQADTWQSAVINRANRAMAFVLSSTELLSFPFFFFALNENRGDVREIATIQRVNPCCRGSQIFHQSRLNKRECKNWANAANDGHCQGPTKECEKVERQ